MPGPEELLTAKEVARLFKVHWKTLCRWAEQGKFPKPFRLEGELRWRAVEVWMYQESLFRDREGEKSSPEAVDTREPEGTLGTSAPEAAKPARQTKNPR